MQKSQNQRDGFIRKTQPGTAGFEDGRGHEPRIAGASRSWERQENGFSPRASRGNPVLMTHLEL